MDDITARIIEFYATPPAPDLDRVTGLEIRERWAMTASFLNQDGPDRKVERGVPVATRRGEALTVDLYPADGAGPHPGVLFIHGGSWVAGSPLTHDKLAQRLAERGYSVVSVDYALAPEHKHPEGLDDCVLAADWLKAEAEGLGIDPGRLAIMGDSAGGNLAAATLHCLLERDGATPFRAAALPYGVYDFPAMLALPEDAPFVNGRIFVWQVEDYLGVAPDDPRLELPAVSPRFSPHLANFPPVFMTAGTRDPLLQQSLDFAESLRAAGVGTEVLVCEEATHAFLQIEEVAAAGEGLEAIVGFLGRNLGS
ncbi:MAG: alpha/beta hydrolase [Chloroflexi bacterium]|nr:alpha/beta hydrolase [Chloroflexota bacterium]